MGTYGTSILGNDTAADVAAEFKDSIAYGKSIEEAEDQLIADFCIDDEDDPYELCPFWLGLAAQQVKMGRLSERTKANALRIIDEGIDIAIWEHENPKLVPKRQTALNKLREQITGPQKNPTKVRKPFIDTIEWEEGDGLAYQLPSGNWTALRVRKVVRETRDHSAYYEVLNIHQPDMPDIETIRNACIVELQYELKEDDEFAVLDPNGNRLHGFWMSRNSKRDGPPRPLVKVAAQLTTDPLDPEIGGWPEGWKKLDDFLKSDYGLE